MDIWALMFPTYLETLYLFTGLGCIVGDHLDSRREPNGHAVTAELMPIKQHNGSA